jgi:hypothetical protein
MTNIKTIGIASFGGQTAKTNILHETNLPIPTFCGACGGESATNPDSIKIKSFEGHKDLNIIELTWKCSKCSSNITITQSYKINQ